MIHNKTITNGIIVYEEIIDLDANTITIQDHGVTVETRELTLAERQHNGPQPLDSLGALATLLAVESVLTVDDAANAVGLTPQDLITEAEAWAVGNP